MMRIYLPQKHSTWFNKRHQHNSFVDSTKKQFSYP